MILRLNSTGTAVRELEQLLIAQGYPLREDGLFDGNTEDAVRDFQQKAGLIVDGLAGDKTLDCLRKPNGNKNYLSQQDLNKAADRFGVPIASIMAVNEVESRGKGFLDDGRPVILFERHVMYSQLKDCKGADAAQKAAAAYPALVNPVRGGYRGGSAEWTRLNNAQSIDEACALSSCSWGAFQIMGYHWQHLGYSSIQTFVTAMRTSEAEHLNAFCLFIESEPELLKALKAKKWADFARIYNGPAYKENLYDAKLSRAYELYAADKAVAA